MSIQLIGTLLRLLVKERLIYRGDFLLGIIAQLISYAGEYVVLWIFISKFQALAGWSWPEIALLYSFGLFTYALGASVSFVQMQSLEGQVQAGTLDSLLVKPLNPYLYHISRGFNLAYIAHLLISGSVLIWALSVLEVSWSWWSVLYVALAVVGGALVQAGLMSAIGASAFVWVRTGFLFTLFFRLKEFISYPLPIFGSFIQILLTFVVPFAFVNYYPAAYLLGKDSLLLPAWGMWLVPAVGPLVYWLGYVVWMRGVNKYQGAGG